MRKKLIKTTRLVILVVFALFYYGTLAQNLSINQQKDKSKTQRIHSQTQPSIPSFEEQSPWDAVKGKREDKSKRDAFSKHYFNEDGSFTAIIGAGPIHYEKNGQFLDIDHSIRPQMDVQFPYANTTNLFESYFGATSHIGIKNKTAEGEIREFLNTKMYWEVNGQAVNVQNSANKPLRIEGDKAYYDNLFGSISAEFITQTRKRKLNYIIPNQQALGTIPTQADYLVFSEDVTLPFGWTAKTTELGVIIKDQLGKENFLYENPFSIDAVQDELSAQGNTVFEIIQLGNTLTIKTKVKTTWLLNNERVFPVKVDPTFTQTIGAASEVGRAQSNGAGAYGVLRFGQQSSLWVLGYVSYNLSAWNATWTPTAVSITLSGSSSGTIHASSKQQIQRVTINPSDYTSWSTYYTAQNGMGFYAEYTGAFNFAGTKNLGSIGVDQFISDLTTSYKKFTVGFRAGGTWNNNSYVNWTTATLNVTYSESTTPPNCATNPYPTDGAIEALNKGIINWKSVDGATSYDVYFGTSSNPPLISPNQSTTSFSITECLLPLTTYYWKVVPKNTYGSAEDCETWSFTTDNKLHIYRNDFETANLGYFGTSGSSVDGWYTNNNSGTGSGILGYNNTWTVGNGINAINGKSVGVTALYNGGLAGQYFQYYSDLGEIHRWIYRPFDMSGLRDIEVNFNWKSGGEANQDYGSVISSINNGANWLMHTEGGLYNDGKYWNSPTTIQSASVILNESRNNQAGFVLGFKWDDLSGNGISNDPTFVVDDIVIKACPYEGFIDSPEVGVGIFEWITDGNTETILSVEGSHPCAYFEWEKSIDGGTTWTIIPGATSSTYTTPNDLDVDTWYRSRVYYSTGCPGVYQEQPFKIIIPVEKPENLRFHNFGGSEQIVFNNSRINTSLPIFRLSHQINEANSYQIEINSASNFTGTSWTQTFSGVYPINTERNFQFTNGFSPLNGTTYYVRARAKGDTEVYSDWTTETFSFTYQTPKEIPDWFQTTQAQFLTDELIGVSANSANNVVKNPSGNQIINGNFANTSGWTTWKTNGTAATIDLSSTDCVNCPAGTTRNLRFNLWTASAISGQTMIVSQEVDLTNVDEITYNANSYYGPNSSNPGGPISNLRMIIGGSSNDELGTVMHTTNQAYCTSYCSNTVSDPNISINTANFTGVHTIKFVVKFTQSFSNFAGTLSFFVNNVVANSSSQGTITSTPIHLASVQEAIGYAGVRWNQTLGSGDFKLTVQGSSDGINFSDITGYTDVSIAGDGEKFVDLSTLPSPPPHIRLVGNLNGEDVVLHDWAVEFLKFIDNCPNSTTWDGATWSNGFPNDFSQKIIFDGNYQSDLDPFNTTGELIGCSIEVLSGEVVIASQDNVRIENEITVHSEGNFLLKTDANLVQQNNNPFFSNSGNIVMERHIEDISNTTAAMDYIYWSSPVNGQSLSGFSPKTPLNRIFQYNESNDYFTAAPESNFIQAKGYAIRAESGTGINSPFYSKTYQFTGVPHNGQVQIPIVKSANGQGYNLVGNPYPSNIDVEKFFQANQNLIYSTVFFWTNRGTYTIYQQGSNYSGTNYAVYNGTGGVNATEYNEDYEILDDPVIKAGQGFLVQKKAVNVDPNEFLVFDNSMRTTEEGIFFDKTQKNRFWLNLKSPQHSFNTMLIGYIPGATNDLDSNYDTSIFAETNVLYSLVGEEKLWIQGRDAIFNPEDIIPLGAIFKTDGIYTIGLKKKEGLFATQKIFLKDKLTGEIHDLTQNDYTFRTRAGEYNERFQIVFRNKKPKNISESHIFNKVEIQNNQKNILIKSSLDKLLEVEIFNLSGESLYKNANVNSKNLKISGKNLNHKVIIVRALTEKGEFVSKKFNNL